VCGDESLASFAGGGSVAFGPEGRLLASVGDGGTVKVSDIVTGQERLTLKPPGAKVNRVRFSPDGKRIGTAGDAAAGVRTWDAKTGEELVSFATSAKSSGPAECLCFSPDGQRLATAGWSGNLHVWNAATGKEILAVPTFAKGGVKDLAPFRV